MGTTAEKFNYAFGTKDLLKTEINKINNVLDDNSTFRSYPQELFNGYLDILNNGTDTLWNNLEKVSQTGTEVALEGVETAPIKMVLNGNTSQDGTPTPDTPVEVKVVKGENVVSVSGKNLLDVNRAQGVPSDITPSQSTKRTFNFNEYITGISANNYYYTNFIPTDISVGNNRITFTSKNGAYGIGMAVKVKPSTDYTISYSLSTSAITNLGVGYYEEDGTYINFIVTQSTNNFLKFTTPENCSFILVVFRLPVDVTATYSNIQLEEGTSITDFVPYSKTDYPIDLVAENLFDKDDARILRGYINISTKSINTSNNDYSVIVKVKPNTKYIVTKMANNPEGQARFRLGTTTNYPQMGGARDNVCNQLISNDTATELSITTDANDNYLVVFCYSDKGTTTLEEMLDSLVVREAEPIYKEMCKIGDYKDYLFKRNGKWYVHKGIGKVVLDGSEQMNFQGSASTPTERTTFRWYLPTYARTDDYLSNKFIKGSSTSNRIVLVSGSDRPYISIDNLLAEINVEDDNNTKLAKFKTWLSNNNVILYYVLATPTETEITNTTLIEQLEAISKAKSVKDKTYITQTNDELPFILDVEAIKEYEVN